MVLFALLYLFVLLLFDSSVKGNNPFITYHNENISEACCEEALKQRAEERFRSNLVPIWFQHIQRSGGYLVCNYARSNGVYDMATKIGCPTCPCGHGSIDKHLDKICHTDLDPSFLINHPRVKNPAHSKKDRSEIANPNVANMNFIMVEFNTFKKCSPVPGKIGRAHV